MPKAKSFAVLQKQIKKVAKEINVTKKSPVKKAMKKKKTSDSYTVVGYTKTGKPIKKKLVFSLF